MAIDRYVINAQQAAEREFAGVAKQVVVRIFLRIGLK
jgi:hypothetical protein